MFLSIEVVANQAGLAQLLRFVDEAEQRMALGEEQAYILRLAIEEIATNLMKYGYTTNAPGPIQVACDNATGTLRIVIRDQGKPFDPHTAPPPDLSTSLERRRVGGLGLFLVRELTDELVYRHDAISGWNELTLIKRAEHERG